MLHTIAVFICITGIKTDHKAVRGCQDCCASQSDFWVKVVSTVEKLLRPVKLCTLIFWLIYIDIDKEMTWIMLTPEGMADIFIQGELLWLIRHRLPVAAAESCTDQVWEMSDL